MTPLYHAPLIAPFDYQLTGADFLKIRTQALLSDVPVGEFFCER